MIDIQDISYMPTLEEISEYVRNPVFDKFYKDVCEKYRTNAKIEYSKCSWIRGWNIKFCKSGKSLCTIYPNENYFTVMVVVGNKEKDRIEKLLSECTKEIQDIYRNTHEGNGQRWLMIELEDDDKVYEDVLRFIEIRHK